MDRESAESLHRGKGQGWLTLLTVAVNGLIIVLDMSIVNLSFPGLTRIFHTEPSVVMWITVVYSLMTVGLIPILGRIADMYGRKKIFVLGYILFTLGLFMCSLSRSILQLIMSRMVQGVGAAMNMALGFALVTDAFPARERGKALGITQSVFAVGPVVGITLGGFLLDALGWRAVFYTRVPICVIGILMAWKFLRETEPLNTGRKIDIVGTATLFGSLSSLLLFLNLGARAGFSSPLILVLGNVSWVFFAVFILQEKRTGQPVIDLRLFRNRLFTGGMITGALFFLAQSAQLFLFPYYLIEGVHLSASEAGSLFAVYFLLLFSVAPLSGWLSDKFGSRPLCTVGMGLMCLGLFLLSRLDADAGRGDIISSLVVLGIGGGLFVSPNTSVIMGAVSRGSLGTAGALIATIRQIGISSGISIAGVIFTIRMAYHTIRLSSSTPDPTILNQLSVIGGYRDTLLMVAGMCFIGIFSVIFVLKGN